MSVIELLNEPAGFLGSNWTSVIRQYWLDGYAAVRDVIGQEVQIMIGDGFLGINVNYFLSIRMKRNLIFWLTYQLELDRFLDASWSK